MERKSFLNVIGNCVLLTACEITYLYIYIFNTSMYFVRKNGGNPDDNFINKKK